METKTSKEVETGNLQQGAVMRRATGIMFKGNELLDGDIVAQHCQMRDDYTGSIRSKRWKTICTTCLDTYMTTESPNN